jgi:cytochrome bd ubiquinol oxidase subunit II
MQYWISFAASSASVVNRLVREQLFPSCSPTTFWFFHIYRFFLTLMFFQPSIHSKWASHGIALACLVSLFVITSGMLTTEKARPALPFLLGLSLFVLDISGIALIAFPDIVPFSVTLWEAASSSTSQTLVLVGAAFVTPVVLAYSALSYWIFRGKTPEQGWEA